MYLVQFEYTWIPMFDPGHPSDACPGICLIVLDFMGQEESRERIYCFLLGQLALDVA
jgi:hypothetical protein